MEEELDAVLKKLKAKNCSPQSKMEDRNIQRHIFFRLCNAVYKQNTKEKWTKVCILPYSKKGYL